MLKLSDSFKYISCKTITGTKLLAGDSNVSSYIYVKNEDEEEFLALISAIQKGVVGSIDDLDGIKQKFAIELQKKGYFEDNIEPKPSFNEFNKYVKVFYMKNFKIRKVNDSPHLFKNICYFVYIFILLFYILFNKNELVFSFNYLTVTFSQATVMFLTIPFLTIVLHELGHYIIAIMLGIPANSIRIGFFITWPTVYLNYNGLNLHSTMKKVSVLFGGIVGHLTGMAIGIIFCTHRVNNIYIQIWILCNFSMIVSNLTLFSACDGYFILSSVLGIFNLRLRGYKALNRMMHRQKVKKSDLIMSLIMIGLWIYSFSCLYGTLVVFGNYFSAPLQVVQLISLVSIIALAVRLILKTYKMNF
jgi:putative peptide zinc metalloprotease protein